MAMGKGIWGITDGAQRLSRWQAKVPFAGLRRWMRQARISHVKGRGRREATAAAADGRL